MQYAIDDSGLRSQPTKNARGFCPSCGERVIAKCGKIKVHHWAHEAGKDCDTWYEPETEWHRDWKQHFPMECVEVPLGEHRADIRINNLVIELQNSPISPAEISARERFYGRMIWIINAEKFGERFFLLRLMGNNLFSFKWKHMKSSWRFARRPVYFDFGAGTVKHLLAATFTDSTVFFTPMGDEESRGSSFVGRYEGPGDDEKTSLGYRADEAFAHLDEEVLGCSILHKNSLHDNGYGSATALSRTKFMAQCGIAPLEFET